MSRRLLVALGFAGLVSGLVIAAITLASDHIDHLTVESPPRACTRLHAEIPL